MEPISEIAGVIVALIILFVTFGSLIAAGLPLITAIIGVGIGALLTVGATAFGAELDDPNLGRDDWPSRGH